MARQIRELSDSRRQAESPKPLPPPIPPDYPPKLRREMLRRLLSKLGKRNSVAHT